MSQSLLLKTKGAAKSAIKALVSPLGIQVGRRGHDWSDVANFIPLEATLKAARDAGLSVGDYIDGVMNNIPGATRSTIEQMSALGVFARNLETIVEIGPGSGRYLEKTLELCSPKRYEIYETSDDWAKYVVDKYRVTRCPTDGKSLSATPSASVDLIQAHKVFSGVAFLPTARYWVEMARVVRPGGVAVFDIVTEACMSSDTMLRWTASGFDNGSYPSMVPRGVAVDFFANHGFDLDGSFIVPMGPGRTETFVFAKRP